MNSLSSCKPLPPSRQAVICLALATVATLALVFAPWAALARTALGVADVLLPLLDSVWLTAVSAAERFPKTVVFVLLFVPLAGACLAHKGLLPDHPDDPSAPRWKKALLDSMTGAGMVWFAIAFPGFAVWTGAAADESFSTNYPAALLGQSPWEHVREGVDARAGIVHPPQPVRAVTAFGTWHQCREAVRLLPQGSIYTVRVNGQPATASACSGWGRNEVTWTPNHPGRLTNSAHLGYRLSTLDWGNWRVR